ncbi:MAG: hypothetical protein V4812_00795 [Pseudomonadota bacterium]
MSALAKGLRISRPMPAFALALGCWCGMAQPTWAMQCSTAGSSGFELGHTAARAAPLNPDGLFGADQEISVLYSEIKTDCSAADWKLHLDAYGERVESYGDAGMAQPADGQETHGLVREAYITLNHDESLFIDVGKKDIRNGQFFFVSPLDFLQNPAPYSSRGVMHAQGISWRDSYREGAMAVQASWFTVSGTLELAVIPQLVSESNKPGVVDASGLERTNGQSRYYAAYTTSLLEDFNPRFVAVGGDTKGFGLGTSGFLTDNWILNVEMAARDNSAIREVSAEALRDFENGQLPSAEEVFVEQDASMFYQFAAGLRYTTSDNLSISTEYLFQDQGLARKQRKNYFDMLDLSERAFAATGIDAFRGYALLFAREADNNLRRDLMQGRQYLMTHMQRDNAELGTLSWETSVIYNIEDHSFAWNAHLSSQLSRHVELYLGGDYLGGADHSEFGRLGTKGAAYAGVRAIW